MQFLIGLPLALDDDVGAAMRGEKAVGWKSRVGLPIASAVPSRAQVAPRGLSSAYMAYKARAQNNTVQSDLCSQAESLSQDARLNKAHKRVMQQFVDDPAGRRP